MTFREGVVAGVAARVCRVSFTGELSYEIHVPSWYGPFMWEAILAAGEMFGVTPYGTEAMHVLRAEKGFVIVGQDTDGTATPDDLGMGWIVNPSKGDFLGKRSLVRPDSVRSGRKQLVGIVPHDPDLLLPRGNAIGPLLDDRRAPRPHARTRDLELPERRARMDVRARDGRRGPRAARPDDPRRARRRDRARGRHRPRVLRRGGSTARWLSPPRRSRIARPTSIGCTRRRSRSCPRSTCGAARTRRPGWASRSSRTRSRATWCEGCCGSAPTSGSSSGCRAPDRASSRSWRPR